MSFVNNERLLYRLSSLENRIPREYYHVVIPYARTLAGNADGEEANQIRYVTRETFKAVLRNLGPLKGRVFNANPQLPQLGDSQLWIREVPFDINDVYGCQFAGNAFPPFDKDNVHSDYLLKGGLNFSAGVGTPPVKLMVTVCPTQTILAFSFFRPIFGLEARNKFLRILDEFNFQDGLADDDAMYFALPAGPFRVEAQAEEVRVETAMKLLHDVYVPSPGAIYDEDIEQAVRSKKLLLSKDRVDQVVSRYLGGVPETVMGYTKAQMATAALLWVAIIEARIQLRDELYDEMSEGGTVRLDMMTSGCHVCEDRDYGPSPPEARWPGNTEFPLVSRMPGKSFCNWPTAGVNEETLARAVKMVAANLRRVDKGMVINFVQKRVNGTYLASKDAYDRALNCEWEGIMLENWTGHNYKGMEGLMDVEKYPRASLAHAHQDCPAGTIRLLPEVDDEDDGKVPVLVAVYEDEMAALVEQKLRGYV
ncbi:hypothetical protein VFPPC_13953 [Pochonia chlamydosporia 170]|uniref:Uncharacterized protein n=1 Tax=Pochonia chlamydosporia 170 TaxID=1380566 RepID=A0A179FH50_METCM|nr:hypothetical protein VFPPC_13953 [Pochonia chlamydosporia 170]OAQ64856.1 hypothetical protein VFPPC_13953 [Pochonia chlamydosporia 170]